MIKPWTQTYTRVKFDLIKPTTDMIDIIDIARGLSMLCRFSGQCNKFYSVAEHSLHVSRLANPKFKLAALLHDASEAYISDLVKPLKELLPEYKIIEKRIQDTICKRFRVYNLCHTEEIKQIDTKLLHHEAAHLLNSPAVDGWIQPSLITSINLKFYNPKEAEQMFLHAFYALYY